MASNAPPPRTAAPREGRGGLSVGTLVIASVASLTAAIVTSYFWTRGTPIAAAITPVIVALVSELLNRPATVIAQRLTTETDALPEAAGAGPPPPRRESRGEAARDDETHPTRATEALEADPPTRPTEALPPDAHPPATAALRQATRERAATARARDANGSAAGGGGEGTGPARVYGGGGGPGRRLPWKPIAVTAALAFVVAASVLTLPELVTGQSVGGGDRGTTFFGGQSRGPSDDDRSRDARERQGTTRRQAPAEQPSETVPEDDPAPRPEQQQPGAAPRQRAPAEPTETVPEETVPEETTPTQPMPTAPQPAP